MSTTESLRTRARRPGGHAASRDFVQRSRACLGTGRSLELRRPGGADRRDASDHCRGEALDRRDRFLHALNYCTLLPGPEAQQLAIYIGWLLHKTKGGLVAGILFVLPGVVAIMALSWIYALFGNVGVVQALFFGLKAAVLAIVLEAVARIGRRALRNNVMIGACGGSLRCALLLPAPFRWSSSRQG